MPLKKESKFRVIVDCNVEIEEADIAIVSAKLGKHLKDAPYVTRVNTLEVQSYEAIEEYRKS